MPILFDQFPCLEDNFGVLVHDEASGRTVSIDAPDAGAVEDVLRRRGWKLTDILTTHHHHDHVGGNLALKARHACTVTGPAAEATAIPGIDRLVAPGDTVMIGTMAFTALALPGHTLGQIGWHMAHEKVLFAADALFSLGCGRIIEGDAAMMWGAMQAIMALPDDTTIHCGHEYTASNARFALSVEPGNAALQARAVQVAALRAEGRPTLPVSLADERAANPFLRPHSPEIRAGLGMAAASDAEVFTELRVRKNNFR
jgi:hydroxyacylglutathione hydrolase